MIFLIILSIILIWLHVSNLRFIIRTKNNKMLIENAAKIEENIPEADREFSFKSPSGLFSLGLLIFMNILEIGYFIACVYVFNELAITIGAAILVGYSLFSMFKFIPDIKRFYKKPSDFVKDKTKGLDNILHIFMTGLEILFCFYIIIKVILYYDIF